LYTEELYIKGVEVNYYYVCKRKLWLFSKGINFENSNERVNIGQIMHQTSFSREKKREVLIDNLIRIDIVNRSYLREIKLTRAFEKAHIMQLVYYLYILRKKGIKKVGIINFVKERRKKEVELNGDYIKEIESVLKEIKEIKNLKEPPRIVKTKVCSKCAYYYFCFSGE
jgi:CRISPR-associated exonuclease Cas4